MAGESLIAIVEHTLGSRKCKQAGLGYTGSCLSVRVCYITLMNAKQAIEEKLKGASLSEAETSLWSETLENMGEKDLEAVLDFINFDSSAIRVATDNLISKTEAWDSGDINKWVNVLESEKSVIQSI